MDWGYLDNLFIAPGKELQIPAGMAEVFWKTLVHVVKAGLHAKEEKYFI